MSTVSISTPVPSSSAATTSMTDIYPPVDFGDDYNYRWTFYRTEGEATPEFGRCRGITDCVGVQEFWKRYWKRSKTAPVILFQSMDLNLKAIGYKTRKETNHVAVECFMRHDPGTSRATLEKTLRGDVMIIELIAGNAGSSAVVSFPTTHLVYQQDDGDEALDLTELLNREGYSEESGYVPPIGSCAYYRNRARKLISTAITDPSMTRDAEIGIFRETIREAIRNNTTRNWKDPIVKSIYDIVFNRVYRNLLPPSSPGSVGNPKLAKLVMDGTISAKSLGRMTPAQLWPEKWQEMEEERILRQIATLEVNMASSTDMFKCKKCKQNKCIYKEMQTRSADEPMTIFVFCLMCGNRWKE